ncbi:DUF481 domain-containing protein [Microbulbifer sp. TYP-18]|uniref:DUF481 domain-containing protein n=1 Tax=Microbulbifer sp. TYP-18 TaxID=3230024 RepID=UPI0034C64F54
MTTRPLGIAASTRQKRDMASLVGIAVSVPTINPLYFNHYKINAMVVLRAVSKLTSILALSLSLVSLPVAAGILTLNNGDRIHGQLVLVEREAVVWNSETFGEIRLGKDKILSLDTDVELKIAGRDDPCTLAGHRREKWELYCKEGSGYLVDFPAVERAEPYAQFLGHPVVVHGSVSVGGVLESGNREREDLDAKAKLDVRHDDWHHLVDVLYQNQDNIEVEGLEKYRLGYSLRWIFAQQWFAAANTSVEREEARNLDLSSKFGLGLGYLFYDTDKKTLSVEGGLSKLRERFIDPALSTGQDDLYAAARAAVNYRYKFDLGPEVYFDQELLQSLDSSDDYQSSAKLGLRMPLAAGLLMETAYYWLYDSTPSLESVEEDTKLTVGVGYQW